jgi:hypothetical protein
MNVTTFNDLFVDELYLNGVKFDVENFKGDPGDIPTIDDDADDYKGDPGDNWNLRYETIEVSEANVGQLLLPDPAAEDYDPTAIHLIKNEVTTGNITVYTHDNKTFMGILYGPHKQSLHFIRTPDNRWIK